MPVEIIEANNAAKVRTLVASGDIDLVLLDGVLPVAEQNAVVEAARAAAKPPFVILLAIAEGTSLSAADAVVAKPSTADEAQHLAERFIRVRIPSQVLIVDDSATVRAIVRKLLAGSRFPLDIQEANDGAEALRCANAGRVDIVFLDYNMPGLDGLATLAELKRGKPEIEVVFMTSVEDPALATRARDAGAAAFLKKPFFPTDIDDVLRRYCGLLPKAV